jgi:hypothetical protein
MIKRISGFHFQYFVKSFCEEGLSGQNVRFLRRESGTLGRASPASVKEKGSLAAPLNVSPSFLLARS